MSLALDVLSWILLGAGSFFCVVTGVGLLRMPDFYTRSHAGGIADTLGSLLILLGLALQVDLGDGQAWSWNLATQGHVPGGFVTIVKLVMIYVFLFITSPTACHALMKAAYAGGLPADPGPETKS